MNRNNLHKVLIANRGEIALRIIEAVKKSGLSAVAIYADNDKELPFVNAADESWPLGIGSLQDTYLNQEKIIQLAKKSKSNAIHPGYGFLSENSEFAANCHSNSIIFIGPSVDVINLMGNKANARAHAKKAGIPVLDGMTGSREYLLEKQDDLVFPLLIKPSAGGGGKGMHIVHEKESLPTALEDASREALNYFNSDQLYIERYLKKARHIEVQIIADRHGNCVHLFERECSLQRRFQKIIEEAPSSSLSEQTRKKILESAVHLAKVIKYTNAGTVEFLVDQNEEFFFIEMNTRIQVEHPVTELITEIDIVKEQIAIANDQTLSFKQEEVNIKGNSIQARIYAEDPDTDFRPSTGVIKNLDSKYVAERMDASYASGNTLTSSYDPMLTKIIAHGKNRLEASKKLALAIMNYHVSGINTNREFLVTLLKSDTFIKNNIHTKYIDENIDHLKQQMIKNRSSIQKGNILSAASMLALSHQDKSVSHPNIWNEIGHWRVFPEIKLEMDNVNFTIRFERRSEKNSFLFSIENKSFEASIIQQSANYFTFKIDGEEIKSWASVDQSVINLDLNQHTFIVRRTDIPDPRYLKNNTSQGEKQNTKEIFAPLNGKIVQLNFKKNDRVKIGDTLLVIESMKMENKITATHEAVIESLNVDLGELVESNKLLITLK